jgi:hypothetical protein
MANTPRTKSQVATVLQFFGPHQEKTDPIPTTPSQIHGFFSQPKPITVPTNPATATGNKGRRIGQFVFIKLDPAPTSTALKRNFFANLDYSFATVADLA